MTIPNEEPIIRTKIEVRIDEYYQGTDFIFGVSEEPDRGLRKVLVSQTFLDPTVSDLTELFNDALGGAGFVPHDR
jgi:hypothetical protein